MTQIISLPDQGPMIGEMHEKIIGDFGKTSRVDYSLAEFIDVMVGEKNLPEVIVMDFLWMDVYASSLYSDLKDTGLKDVPVIGIHMNGDVESAHARFRSYFNIVKFVNTEAQWIDPVMMQDTSCGLKDAIQRVLDVQERIRDRAVTRFDVTGKGSKPTKYAKFIV